jgi:hypothetical protein
MRNKDITMGWWDYGGSAHIQEAQPYHAMGP